MIFESELHHIASISITLALISNLAIVMPVLGSRMIAGGRLSKQEGVFQNENDDIPVARTSRLGNDG